MSTPNDESPQQLPITITTLIDSFKHSFSSKLITTIAQTVFSTPQPTYSTTIQPHCYQISDGGEGFIDAMSNALQIEPILHEIIGPLNEPITAAYLYDPAQQLIVIESAQGVGIQSIPKDRLNPLVISSFGVGRQLRHVLLNHPNVIKTIILGLGGTASVDCGLGLLYGLLNIACFRTKRNQQQPNQQNQQQPNHDSCNLTPTNGPFDVCLNDITAIKLPENREDENFQILQSLCNCNIILASDVTNPLLGLNGAAYIFGPQKGIKKEELVWFETGMTKFSSLLQQLCHTPDDLHIKPGCGAAGGIGFALYCLFYYHQHCQKQKPVESNQTNNNTNKDNLKITFQSGFELLYSYTNISKSILLNPNRHLIITGEGSFDSQSLQGKVIDRVCSLISKAHYIHNVDDEKHNINIPVIILCGNGFESIIGERSPPPLHFKLDHKSKIDDVITQEQEEVLRRLAEMNIIKIININNPKYHDTTTIPIPSFLNSPSYAKIDVHKLDPQSLDYKLAMGVANTIKVLSFLRQLILTTMDTTNNNDLTPFISALQQL
jgi:glycerate kinase